MKKKLLVCALALTFALSGCSASQNSSADSGAASETADESLTESVEGEVYEEDDETNAAEPSETAKADMDLEISDKNLADGKASDFVTIGDYKNLQVTYPEGTTAEAGMTANIDFSGTVVGEDAPRDGMTSEDFDLQLGSNTFIEGFEDALIGHKSGETVEFTIPFPANYAEETLAGKDTDWVVTIHSLSNGTVATAFTDFTNTATISSFPKDVYDSALEYIKEIYTISAENNGQTLDDFIAANKIDLDMQARSEARSWLVSKAVMEAENVTEESDEYTTTMSSLLQVFGYKTLEDALAAGMPESYIKSITARQTAILLATPDAPAAEPTDASVADDAAAAADSSAAQDTSASADTSSAAK